MKVGVNLCWLVPGVVGGSEQALVRTLGGLADHGPADLELVLFALDGFRVRYPDVADRFETFIMPGSARLSSPGLASKGLRVMGEHAWLPTAARRARLDVLHDGGGTTPGRIDIPRVVTVHDIQPLDLPGNFSPVKVAYLRRAIPAAVRKAAAVAVPSQFVADRVEAVLGVEPDRLHVVPWPTPKADSGRPARHSDTPFAYQNEIGQREEGPFVLQNVITYPHKDHATTIRAFARIAERHPELRLVITGGQGPSEQTVRDQIAHSGFAERIIRTGRLDDAAIAGLIDHAAAVVIPSRYEGFGIPALEAMAAGTPVVVADAGSLPEVVGDAGVVIPPGDDAQLAIELCRLLEDDDHATDRAERGKARAAAFSPQRTAKAMTAVYRIAASAL